MITLQEQAAKPAGLKFTPDDQSHIIDDDFVMVITHPDLEEELKLPFLCALITKQDWTMA